MPKLTALSLSLTLAACSRGDAAAPTQPASPAPPGADRAQPTATGPATRNLFQTAADDGSFQVLGVAFELAGLTTAFQDLGPYTVFAPTDDAFAALPVGTTEALLADVELLTLVLAYHVVPGTFTADDLAAMTTATTVLGAQIEIDGANGTLKINDASVVHADLMASNGVIHAIDTVLVPHPPPVE